MTSDELIGNAITLRQRALDLEASHRPKEGTYVRAEGIQAQVLAFLHDYVGPRSPFYTTAKNINKLDYANLKFKAIVSVLEDFILYVEAGLNADVSPERRAELDIVSDFLELAERQLNDKNSHPAVASFLIGATLEEFLRTWVENTELSLGNKKLGLNNYATTLRGADLISKQDVKDVTSWSGLRNHAAHGEWEDVADKKRIAMMLEGMNLFMRKYGA